MSEPKTKPTKASVKAYIDSIEHDQKRNDAKEILKIMKAVTRKKPAMWGESIVGFDTYHYVYASGREGDWPMAGFSARKANLTIYIMPGFKKYESLLKKLGKYTHSVSCLYIKKLADVDMKVLRKLIERGYKDMQKMYKKK